MTEHELKLIDMLAQVWNEYLKLPEEGPHDTDEFRTQIHILQRQIMSRPARRQLRTSKQR